MILQAEHLNKYFYDPKKFQVLNDITFRVERGEFVSITGKSGCGKSTLLYLLSTMDTDYEGRIIIDDVPVTGKKQNELAQFRNERIGFIFQFHYLLPEFTALDNVMIPGLKLGKYSRKEVEAHAYHRLEQLGVAEHAKKRANKLSGGQQQRVAIARALINEPAIIMGDEPTGNLDSANTEIVFEIFRRLADEQRQTIITVTHDEDFARRSDRIIEMKDGAIVS
ncbi:lipoprotein-releasing system ATP-binding protein [Catalinimonas alkaloidigena]|uniref:Lipoprotein-releasing system ATP-binding protein n=1 Tax=Catalinimonas alkaloidigena TaxID=1075417 RepID=A0A1G9SAP5_9BACT|nr:ABC transporter ATP-binding protein [Catalinimonas alkaloidigena]SDM32420.1 lipoprotein-releasing system ATP-binding protein [Catalinimonas alkaloidigena]